MNSANSFRDRKWYGEGLAFGCQGCGRCCSGPEEGYIWISAAELEDLADYLHISVGECKKQYAHRVGIRYSLIEQHPSKDCIFLRQFAEGKRCAVYPVRPLQCRTWPFWKENLRSVESWRQAGYKCPGINHGGWYSQESIDAICQGRLGESKIEGGREAAVNWIGRNLHQRECLQAIAELYEHLDHQLESLNPECENCGLCCDFAKYGHRLYVTTLEMLFFISGLQAQSSAVKNHELPRVKAPTEGKCPYRDSKGCTTRALRAVSCRIFYCRGISKAYQNDLTERVLGQLRRLHEQFGAIYWYGDILDWLQYFSDCEMFNRAK